MSVYLQDFITKSRTLHEMDFKHKVYSILTLKYEADMLQQLLSIFIILIDNC